MLLGERLQEPGELCDRDRMRERDLALLPRPLNESRTLPTCIAKARRFIEQSGIAG